MKKIQYIIPMAKAISLDFGEMVCQAASGTGDIPDYDPITNPGFNAPEFPGLIL